MSSIGRRRFARSGRCSMVSIRLLVILVLFGATAHAGDWPQWLGPKRDGGTTETVATWKDPLKIAWRQPICLNLGLDPHKQNISNVGRPIRLVKPGYSPLCEILS